MKTLNEMIARAMTRTAILAMALIFGSCSDSDDTTPPGEVAFPDLQTLTVAAGNDDELTFTAEADWVLTSNAAWCRFVDGDFAETSVRGKAGEQRITLRISDAEQNYNTDDVAEITMKMGDKSQVICKVTRPRKSISGLIILDQAGKECGELLIMGGSVGSPADNVFRVLSGEANAEVGITKNPSWLTVVNQGDGNFNVFFKTDNSDGKSEKYPISKDEGATITFAAQDKSSGKILAEKELSVAYDALAADALAVDPSFMNVSASEDGQTLTGEGGLSGGEAVEYGSELVSTVTTRNDEFEIIEFLSPIVDEKGELIGTFDFSAKGDLDWVKTEKIAGASAEIKDRVRVTVSALPEAAEARHATVMLFPKAEYDKVKDDMANQIIDEESKDIKSAYTSYILADILQEKYKEPAPGIEFVGYYYTSYEDEAMLMTFEEVSGQGVYEPKMENISDTPEGDAIYSEYGLSVMPKKNIWKATVPAGMMGDTNNRLGIGAVGMSEGATLEAAFSVSGITGEMVSAPTTSGQKVSFWSAYLTDGGKPSGYQVIVMDPSSGIIDAVCVVEITD